MEGHVTFDLERGGNDLDMVCLVCIECSKVILKLGQISAKRSFKLGFWCCSMVGLTPVGILLLFSMFSQLIKICTKRYYKFRLCMSIPK